MAQSLHKILIHGPEIGSLLLPTGLFSEKAQEVQTKEYKCYREHHSCKVSRMKTNEDVMKRLLGTFDSVISSNRKYFHQYKKNFFSFFARPKIKQILSFLYMLM